LRFHRLGRWNASVRQSDNETPCIPKETTTQAIEQLLAKVESTNSKSKLNEQKAEIGINSTESTMKSMQDEIKNGVAKDLKGIVEQQKKLERLVTMSDVAMRYIADMDLKPKRLIRPSSFPLINYEKECNQLKKSLRELQGQS